MIINVIPLWEPWATAMAVGVKTYETRHYRASKVGLPLGWTGIYATKKYPPEGRRQFEEFGHQLGGVTLTSGAIVAVGWFSSDDAVETVSLLGRRILGGTEEEANWGNYEPGRRAWKLESVRRLLQPFPCRGRQGWWKVDLPDHLFHSAIQVSR